MTKTKNKLNTFELKRENWNKISPFPYKTIKNTFKTKFAIRLRKKLIKFYKDETIDFNLKDNDLFTFFQSKSISSYRHIPIIRRLEKIFTDQNFISQISEYSGVKLNKKVDIFLSVYTQNNHLLCHDDRLESRAIAFIYYLTPEEWTQKDGGYLQLFGNKNGFPTTIKQSIKPEFNSLTFFKVSDKSFHQVQEVKTPKLRVSVTGWFHSDQIDQNPVESIPKPLGIHKLNIKSLKSRSLFQKYVNPIYLFDQNITNIRKHIQSEESIQLQQFLKPKYAERFLNELGEETQWRKDHLPNYHCYHYQKKKAVKKNKLNQLLRSNEIKVYLQMIGAFDEVKEMEFKGRKFIMGDYDLLNSVTKVNKGTDVLFTLIKGEELCQEEGGTTYYTTDERQEFSIEPKNNCLSIVNRPNDEIRSFVKFMNNGAVNKVLYEMKGIWS